MTKKKTIVENDDDEMIVLKVCAKQGVCKKCKIRGSAVCLTCAEYQQMIQNDGQLFKLMRRLDKIGKEVKG